VPITGIRGDADRIYVTSTDGILRVFTKGPPLSLTATRAFSSYLGTVDEIADKIYVTVGQAKLTVDNERLYLAQLNEGEVALEIDKATLEITRTYGQTFVQGRTVAYDRLTGTQLGTVAYPPQQLGPPGQPNLYVAGDTLLQLLGGCCGLGISVVKLPEFVESGFVDAPFTNAVVATRNGFVSGMETGEVGYFNNQLQLVQTMNLPVITGHTGPEEIELRAVWTDSVDDLVFAASTWGNAVSRGPDLPSFFVLRLR
jgi:hypothetical protein